MFGWTGNMERLAMSNAHQKSDDPMRSYHLNQKKTLEINPRHPVIKGKRRLINFYNDLDIPSNQPHMLGGKIGQCE